MDHDHLKEVHDALIKDNRAAYALVRKDVVRHEPFDLSMRDLVQLYKGPQSYEANKRLRGEALKLKTKAYRFFVDATVEAMETVCLAAKTSRSVKVYRVVRGEHAASLCRSPGTSVNAGFSSWAFDANRALDLVDPADGTATLLVATLPKGTPHFYIDGLRPTHGAAQWVFQSEIVLAPGKITTVKSKSFVTFYPGLRRTPGQDDPDPFGAAVKLCKLTVTIS